MITILADPHNYHTPPPDATTVSDVGGYVALRMAIRRALNRQEPLAVYVSDPVVLSWLSDLQQYPSASVTWQTIDPAEEFLHLFGSMPTAPFSPAQIAALDLSTLSPPPPGANVDPLSWILGEHVGDLWRYTRVSPDHLAQLVVWAIHHAEPYADALVPLVQAKIDEWATQNAAYHALHAPSLQEDALALTTRWAFQRYDVQWQQRQSWGNLPLVDVSEYSDVWRTTLQVHDQAVKAYWGQFFAQAHQSGSLLFVALEQMSGLSDAELSSLIMMLERHPNELTIRLFQRIEQRFRHLPTAATMLRRLKDRIAPPVPSLPDSSWSSADVLRWAAQSYLPYFGWVIRTQHTREHQQACALWFSDWLYNNYPSWLNTEQSPVLLNQYSHMRQILDADPHAVVVWLVVDGLTWWQGQMLQEECEQHGLYLQSCAPAVAVLPSITRVSKRALVTGIPSVDLEQSNIGQAARTQFVRSGIHGHVSYNMQKVINVLQRDSTLRCGMVLFNTIDVLAHQMSVFSDTASIRGALSDLAGGLAQVRNICATQGRQLHVLVGSDHGSTLLPSDAASLPLPRTTHEIEDVWDEEVSAQEKHKTSARAAVIAEPERIVPTDQVHWYVLDRHHYQLDQHYIVPRGYQYVKRRPTGWTHGGLTPEEVVVPLLHFTPERVMLQAIGVEITGVLRAGQETPMSVSLVNANGVPLDDVVLRVGNEGAEVQVGRIEAVSKQQITVVVPPAATQATEISIHWSVAYRVAGTLHEHAGMCILPIRRLQTQDSSFDDLFSDS